MVDPRWKNFVALRDAIRRELKTTFDIDAYDGGGGEPHIEVYLKWWTSSHGFTILLRPAHCMLQVDFIHGLKYTDHKVAEYQYANPNFLADIIHDLGEYLPRMY
jgi:hypothetical protein